MSGGNGSYRLQWKCHLVCAAGLAECHILPVPQHMRGNEFNVMLKQCSGAGWRHVLAYETLRLRYDQVIEQDVHWQVEWQ